VCPISDDLDSALMLNALKFNDVANLAQIPVLRLQNVVPYKLRRMCIHLNGFFDLDAHPIGVANSMNKYPNDRSR